MTVDQVAREIVDRLLKELDSRAQWSTREDLQVEWQRIVAEVIRSSKPEPISLDTPDMNLDDMLRELDAREERKKLLSEMLKDQLDEP